MSKTVATAIAALASTFIGATVMVNDKATDTPVAYKVLKLSDKLGSLKDGTKGEYIVLARTDDEAIVINVHPQTAKTLFTKGEASGMQLVPAEPEKKEKKARKVKAEKADAPATPKEPSKKDLFMEAYRGVVTKVEAGEGDASSIRQQVKAAVAGLGLSDPGFNTYYQNAKSGKWA